MGLYRMEEWEDRGKWHCNYTKEGRKGGLWFHPARILGIPADKYIELVIKEYNAEVYYHNEDCSLVFIQWNNQKDMRRFKNFINKKARERNYII